MEKKHFCVICKYNGIFHFENSLDRAQLYDSDGGHITITLCKSHAVDLFKRGQKKFLLSHYRLLTIDSLLDEDAGFTDLLERTVRKNYQLMF